MKFPYLHPRSAKSAVRLDTFLDDERADLMVRDAYRVKDGMTDIARPTPEYRQWVDEARRRHSTR